MPDILYDFPVAAPPAALFGAVSTPAGLDRWWTLTSAGTARAGEEYRLGFGPEHDWRATVVAAVPAAHFALRLTRAMPDWMGTTVAFDLEPAPGGGTLVHFAHRGWTEETAHFRTTAFCWAMYLRILRRSLEAGEQVPYHARLAV